MKKSTMMFPHPLPIQEDLLYESDTRSGDRLAVFAALFPLVIRVKMLPDIFVGIFYLVTGGRAQSSLLF